MQTQSLPPINKASSMSNIMSIPDMYSLVNRVSQWGIEGYEVPRKFFDY